MLWKAGKAFEVHFPLADLRALALLRRLLAFDPADRPSAEEALADPYFASEWREWGGVKGPYLLSCCR